VPGTVASSTPAAPSAPAAAGSWYATQASEVPLTRPAATDPLITQPVAAAHARDGWWQAFAPAARAATPEAQQPTVQRKKPWWEE
jgi:hypothetical protein